MGGKAISSLGLDVAFVVKGSHRDANGPRVMVVNVIGVVSTL